MQLPRLLAAVALGTALAAGEVGLEPLAELGDQRAASVTVSVTGRIFVCYPRCDGEPLVSVAEVLPDGASRAVPDRAWNAWRPGGSPEDAWICAHAVYADRSGFLWILDAAAPERERPIVGGVKLVQIDLEDDAVVRVVRFAPEVVTAESRFDDVRVTDDGRHAFVSDGGAGTLVVVELASGSARRVLAGHPSLARRGEARPADRVRLALDGRHLAWRTPAGDGLWRAGVAELADPELPPERLTAAVEHVADPGAHDGLAIGGDGRLYLALADEPAIGRFDPADGSMATVLHDPRLAWPAAIAAHPDGSLVVAAARGGEPYRLWRLDVPR